MKRNQEEYLLGVLMIPFGLAVAGLLFTIVCAVFGWK